MKLEIFDLPDPSGRFSKESFLQKNYPDQYKFILDFTQVNNLIDIPFREKVYLSVHNMISVPSCKNPNCSNLVKFKNSTLGYLDYCSNKCISSDPNIKDLKEKKSFEKYGTKAPAQSQQIKDKIIQTNNEKYGGNSPMSSEITKKKNLTTLQERYGVDNPSKVHEFLEKRIDAFKKSNFRENFKISSINKYGVDNPWKVPEIRKKSTDYFYKNYRNRIENLIKDRNIKFIDFEKNITTNLIFKCGSCNENFKILTHQFYYRVNNLNSICTNCFPISQSSSISQIEVSNFIKDYFDDIKINSKEEIKPYEIDIYLENTKIGFEYNGVFWHSSKFKKPEYHLSKLKIANSKNIDLFTIWEDDWVMKNDICKSFILNKLKKTPNSIYARKCEIREVSYIESQSFLDSNHFQGDIKSPIRLGLYHEGSLVSLMTFGSLRLPISSKSEVGTYELTRFCNLTYHNVVGGASKLLKYFIRKYSPKKIISYSDNLISNGGLYEKLGFKYVHTSKPGYWYNIDGIRSHRYNWRKSKLVKMGYDPKKTEEEIMDELGYHRIYNGGNKKWELSF